MKGLTRRLRAFLAAAMAALVAATPASAAGSFVGDVPLLRTFTGTPGSVYGWAVSEIADLDGDGAQDVIISAPLEGGAGQGAAYAVSSASGSVLAEAHGQPGDLIGYAIADGGDLDGDGAHDLVTGGPQGGVVQAVSGADGSAIWTADGGVGFGAAVASAGDVNGDGHDDVLVGAPRDAGAGRVHVLSGVDGSLIRSLAPQAPGELFGTATDWVGDIDGDGMVDHVVGARDAGKFDDGAAYAFSGASGEQIFRVVAPKAGEDLGYFFVAGLPDMTGDGTPDVYVADFAHSERGSQRGKVYVVSGATGVVARTWLGSSAKQGFGPGREAGDIDGDGVNDLAVGSYLSSDGAHQAGKAQVLSGSDGSVLREFVSLTSYEQLGFDAIGIGDVDGGGTPDLVISAANRDTVYLIAGEAP